MLNHSVTNLSNGFVSLNIELPSSLVNPILLAFNSMTEIARSASVKTRIVTSPDRIEQQKEEAERYHLSYCNAITKKFDELWLTGLSVRECISETNTQLKPLFPNSCYTSVKHILAKANRLKNKSFNCEKNS